METLEALDMNIASQYYRDVPMAPGFQLWGTCEGVSVPYHRKWWVFSEPNQRVVGFLDQGCYSDSSAAGRQRRRWVESLGALA